MDLFPGGVYLYVRAWENIVRCCQQYWRTTAVTLPRIWASVPSMGW